MGGMATAALVTAGAVAGTIAIDRATKLGVEHALDEGERGSALGIPLERRTNSRGIQGVDKGSGTDLALIATGGAFALGVAGAGAYFGRGGGWQGRLLQAGAGILAGGMAANLADRAFTDRGVTDFLPTSSRLGVINVGDIALATGFGLGAIGAMAVALR